MNSFNWAFAVSVVLFAGMLVALEIGFRIARRDADAITDAHEGIGVIEAAIFALLGLLLAFSFGGATSRLDARRQLIVQEANAISSAYSWLDILPVAEQPAFRRAFREYIAARLKIYEQTFDSERTDARIAEAAKWQRQIWDQAVAAGQRDQSQNTTRLLLPAVSSMIDVTTARTVALRTHLPALIFGLLMAVAILSAFVAGYAMSKRPQRSVIHSVLFAAAVSITVYTVLDLDDPRFGLIRLDAAEKILHQLHDSIRA